MQIFKLAQCPYCGRKIGLLKCWILKTQGEYRCPKCGGYSNIVLHPALVFFGMISVLISAAVFLVQILLIREFSLTVLFLVFLPFLLFFLSSPFLVRFKKPVTHRRPPEDGRGGPRIEPPETQNGGYRIEPPGESRRRGLQSPPPGAQNRNGGERSIVMNYTRKL
jgi:NAD-dependent protein deacetylases, SIR2 family